MVGMAPVRVRLASPADSPALARMLWDFNTEFDTPTPPVDELGARLTRLLAQSTTFAVIAEGPTRGFGLVTLRTNVWSGTTALLDELYVEPAGRGAGWGSALLDLAMSEARRRGATEFEVEVDEPDTDAQRFYARHGLPLIDAQSGDRAFIIRREIGDR